MSDVRANSGVPVIAQFGGTTTPSACAPLVVDSTTGIIYSWKTGDVIVAAGAGGTVTNLTGPITSVGNATAVASQTGTGSTFAMQAVPSFSTTIGVGAATAAASGSGVSFPATQSASSDVNTLDDYEEGTWTPVLTFGTPGDLSVSYTRQLGTYTKVGRLVTLTFAIVTSAFTWTTASGNLNITGLPFTPLTSTGYTWDGSCTWGGITKVGYTQISSRISSASTTMVFQASGSGVATSAVGTTDMPTGGSVVLRGQVTFETA